MQATVTTGRVNLGQIKKAALAVGIVASLAVGAMTIAMTKGDSGTPTGRSGATTSAIAAQSDVLSFQFQEQNLELPTGSVAATASNRAHHQFLEQNLELPTGGLAPATNGIDYRFHEMNLELPTGTAVATPDWRIIEENSWGEDFVFATPSGESVAPSPDDVAQPRAGELTY